jgi:hypothetical protein
MMIFIATSSARAEGKDSWDIIRENGLPSGRSYEVSSGTGFFVAPGYVITNEHVVENCLTISLRGAVDPVSAELIAKDKDEDLALLKTTALSKENATLRDNEGLKTEDQVYIIGYPLEHARDGKYSVAHAQIVDFQESLQTAKQIEFTAAIEHGNSGGPLIDNAGNVIGVVQAKKKYFHQLGEGKDAVVEADPYKVDGVAIGLSLLEEFLNKNGINYKTSNSSDIFVNFQPESKAKDYVVNIHCVQNQTEKNATNLVGEIVEDFNTDYK